MAKRSIPLDRIQDTPVWPRCVWPGCFAPQVDPRPDRIQTPLCSWHVQLVFQAEWPFQGTPAEMAAENARLERQISELEARLRERTRATPTDGTIYFLRCEGSIKIGWTSNLTQRMRGYPPNTVMLATMPGTRSDESQLKRRFAVHATHGREWFAAVPTLMQHIDQVIAEHGAPPKVEFAAKRVAIPQPRPKSYVGGNYRGNWQRGESPTGKTA